MPRTIPLPPQTQARSSSTFNPPILDGTLSLPEQYEWHGKHSPDHPLFIYATENKNIRTILWKDVVKAMHSGSRLIRRKMGWVPGMKNPPVIAILAASDSITYFTTLISILRAGYIGFAISPRNSPAAVAHLINKVNVKCLFVGHDTNITELADKALQVMASEYPGSEKPFVVPMPVFEDLYANSADDPDDLPFEKRDPDDIILYMHSSGSTAFPKPITRTGFRFAQLSLSSYYGERDFTGTVWSLHVLPMYHGMGVMQLGSVATTGHILATFEPKSPAIAPTPKNHFEAAVACNCDIIFSVPAVIEAWSRQPDYVEWLSKIGGVLYGGGPLDKAVGDYLTSKGVPIFNMYGFTEGGMMSVSLPAQAEQDWEYFKFAANISAEMVPQADGTFEFVMVNNGVCDVSVVNTQINGVDAYATSDLFVQHPQKAGYWRIYGRADDQIMHSTGEKAQNNSEQTNPGPLESIINQDPHVQSSIMFGRGRFNAGILVEPKPEFRFDPSDENKLAEFRNKIWPSIQRMNSFAPQHSRIFKEMILVTKPSKPFQYTAKNTPRRHAMVNAYSEEIEAAYNAVADSAQVEISPPTEWDALNTHSFVRSVVNKVLPQGIDDSADIFQHGCDSLQATWIRNTLLRALRDSAEIDTRNLVDNFVYEHPTISSLASFVKLLATGGAGQHAADRASRVSAMLAMVDKYTCQEPALPTHNDKPSDPQISGDVVLVTGTTGALGSYLLAELISNARVSRVYALNRPSKAAGVSTLAERQANSLVERGLESDVILGSDKLMLLEANLSLPDFGLPEDVYQEMLSSVTHIVHNAWPVDFNLSLTSFESSIRGLHNLVNFALSSPHSVSPTLVFTSSIGVLQNIDRTESSSILESPIPAEVAVNTGYTESKWVSEEILLNASKTTRLNSIIVRVGQLSGGLNGCWNPAEWLPSLVQSGKILGCLPTDDKVVDWIPLPLAAKALIDYRLSGTPGSSTILHLVHPNPVPWSKLATPMAKALSAELVSFSEWVKMLEEAKHKLTNEGRDEVEAMRTISALRLLPFFRSMSAKSAQSDNAFGLVSLSRTTALRLSPTLSNPEEAQPLEEKDALAWLHYWERIEFIKRF
ncbi:acetyl-CoA synthetase-like protein [Agrocybe pediades]|nr:acetyl-CoA synthetase-like protein [Agrocybe pediades]